jgi:hypothetical protein
MKTDVRTTELFVNCPFCGSKNFIAYPDGNTIDVPLACTACGRNFTPKFYCPDRKANRRHVFESQRLFVDNLNGLYTFCPEHSYTTYDLVKWEPDRMGLIRSWVMTVQDSLSVMLFRLALALEGIKQRLVTQRSGGQVPPR